MTKCPKRQKHCLHFQGGTTNGMALKGEDTFKCCWCGQTIVRGWTKTQDESHGIHVDTAALFYDDNGDKR